jgi:hypothetical protein
MIVIEQAIEVINGKFQPEFGVSKPIWAVMFNFNNLTLTISSLKYNKPPDILLLKERDNKFFDGEIIKIK